MHACRNKVAHNWLWRPIGRGVTRLQASVETAVRELGHECESEACVRGMSVDIWVPAEGLALEVDGPLHFAVNQPRHALGPTRLKRRLLRRCGVRAVAVPFYEWTSRHPEHQREYLRQLLQAADAVARGGGCCAGGMDMGKTQGSATGRVRGRWHGWASMATDAGIAAGGVAAAAQVDACSSEGGSESEGEESGSGDERGGRGGVSAARVNLLQYQHGRLNKQQLLKKAALRQIHQRRRAQ